MKTISTVLFISIIFISGCKKNYTCTCTTTTVDTYGSTTTTNVGTTTTNINKAKKSDANLVCNNSQYTSNSSTSSYSSYSNCTLK